MAGRGGRSPHDSFPISIGIAVRGGKMRRPDSSVRGAATCCCAMALRAPALLLSCTDAALLTSCVAPTDRGRDGAGPCSPSPSALSAPFSAPRDVDPTMSPKGEVVVAVRQNEAVCRPALKAKASLMSGDETPSSMPSPSLNHRRRAGRKRGLSNAHAACSNVHQ
jgi:hypothetical protein